jgi:hypothetical protein
MHSTAESTAEDVTEGRPMRPLLRTLIALNWTVAGVAFCFAYYGYPQVYGITVRNLAYEEMKRHSIKLEPTSPDQQPEKFFSLQDEMRSGTDVLYRFGSAAWWGLVLFGCVNAISLIVVFRHTQPARFIRRDQPSTD